MKEEFLHYLWKYNLYDQERLTDEDGNKITVINPGEYNRDSGPDFFNARLIIDGTLWAGNVEIHVRASHFDTHGHYSNPNFDNIILHVVAENDKKIFNSRGEAIPATRLIYDSRLYDSYQNLVNNPFVIACQHDIGKLDQVFVRHWISTLVVERLQDKCGQISRLLSETGNDWEEVLYRLLVRYFGFRVNTEPFEMLAKALPFKVIRKHSDDPFQIEAMLFGTAGMLDEALFREALSDAYYVRLIKEYKILSAKYSLKPLHGWIWKFARLRPANFPTIRISQLSAMLSVTGGLFSRVLEADDVNRLKDLLEVSASEYWNDHYVFGKKSRKYQKSTGTQAKDIILINAIIPLIFMYGRVRDSVDICEKAMSFLEEIHPEENSIIDEWRNAGIISDSAFDTQGLIQLRNNYCKKRKCIDCRIGARLISLGMTLKDQSDLILEQ